jgi:CubicO group peptidase (beta-lactamase class C family)
MKTFWLLMYVAAVWLHPVAAQAGSAVASQVPAQPTMPALETLILPLVNAGGYLGAVTLVSHQGKIVHWQSQGYRNLARTMPMERDSIFRIYSMTKTVVAVAAMMLVEEGKLALDDPVEKYLPEFAAAKVWMGGSVQEPQLRAAKRSMRVWHLLTHTDGFASGGDAPEAAIQSFQTVDLHQVKTLKDFGAHVARQPLAHDPGERFHYDGAATEVMSRLVEVVSGQPFDQFLQQRILTPLGMKDTGFSVPPGQRHRVVDMVTTDAQGVLERTTTADALQPGAMLKLHPSGAGGLYSTAADYLRLCQMLLGAGTLDGVTLLQPTSVAAMMTNQLGSAHVPRGALREGEGFGFGGYVVLDQSRRDRLGSIGAFGWSGAGSTYYTIDRKENLIAMLLMQHLPQGLPKDPPKLSASFFTTVYQALLH